MLKIDDFIVKENGRFFVDFEEWKNGNGISYEDGDLIRFTFDKIKYIGTLIKQGKEENIFEIKNIKEVSK